MIIDITTLKILLMQKNIDYQDEIITKLKEFSMRWVSTQAGRDYEDFPMPLDYIADEITMARINLLQSEGLKAEHTDISRFDYRTDIYSQWIPVIDDWVDLQERRNRRKLKMI